ACQREQQRADDHLVKEGIGQYRLVVAETYPVALLGYELAKAVVLQRKPGPHRERQGEDTADHGHAGCDQRVGKEIDASPGRAAPRVREVWFEVRRCDRHSHRTSPPLTRVSGS